MVRHLALAREIVRARHGIGEHGLQEVLAVHALQLVRHPRATAVARHGKRERRAPPPARLEDRRLENRLRERLADRVWMEIAEHVLERERMRRVERKDEAL